MNRSQRRAADKTLPGGTTVKLKTPPIKLVKLTACIPEGRKTITIFKDYFTVPVMEHMMFHGDAQFSEEDVGKLVRMGNNLAPMVGIICTVEDEIDFIAVVKEQFTGARFVEGLQALKKNLDAERKAQDARIASMIAVSESGKSRTEDLTNFKPKPVKTAKGAKGGTAK